jgi:hypothetical protein
MKRKLEQTTSDEKNSVNDKKYRVSQESKVSRCKREREETKRYSGNASGSDEEEELHTNKKRKGIHHIEKCGKEYTFIKYKNVPTYIC